MYQLRRLPRSALMALTPRKATVFLTLMASGSEPLSPASTSRRVSSTCFFSAVKVTATFAESIGSIRRRVSSNSTIVLAKRHQRRNLGKLFFFNIKLPQFVLQVGAKQDVVNFAFLAHCHQS